MIDLRLLQLHLHTIAINKIQQWLKVCWSGKWAVLDGMLVGVHYALDARHLWTRNIPIQRKAVTGILLSRKFTSESERWKGFIGTILLKNISNRKNSLLILVWKLWIHIMKRAHLINSAIRCREINSDLQIDLTSSKNIVKERNFLLNYDLRKVERDATRFEFERTTLS